MTLAQRLKILAKGAMLGGDVSYQLDVLTGLLTYALSCKVRWFIFPIPFSKTGSVKVDLATFLSASMKPGLVVSFGIFQLTVESIVGHKATCSVVVSGDDTNERGSAILDLSGKYIHIDKIDTDGSISGHAIPLSIVDEGVSA